MSVLQRWNELYAHANGRTTLGEVGVRDPEYPCSEFDASGYDGYGNCQSDGHYLCTECSKLSKSAPRFSENGADGRMDRIRARRRTLHTRLTQGEP